jgi:hypothetical protein
MRTAATLADPAVLLAGTLQVHRRGPERGRPYLQVSIWCGYCRHHHYLPWPDVFRVDLDAIVGPLSMPCRGSPWGDREVYLGLDSEHRAAHAKIAEGFAASLRRYEVQKKLERQLVMLRAEDKLYVKEYPDGIHKREPIDHLLQSQGRRPADPDPSGLATPAPQV